MDIIELARQIGKEIQKDERYLNLHRKESEQIGRGFCDRDAPHYQGVPWNQGKR